MNKYLQGLKAALVILAAYAGMRIMVRGIDRHFKVRDHSDDAAIRTYKRVCRYSVLTIGVLIALHVAGVKLTSLFTTSGLVAVALGFALKEVQEITDNWVIEYNEERPHESLGNLAPKEYLTENA